MTFAGLLVLVGAVNIEAESLTHDQEHLTIATGKVNKVDYPGYVAVPVGSDLVLAARRVFVTLLPGEHPENIAAVSPSAAQMALVVSPEGLDDVTTSSEGTYSAIEAERNSANRLGEQPLFIVGEHHIGDLRCAELLLLPVTVDSSGHLWFHPSVQIAVSGRDISEGDFVSLPTEPRLSRDEIAGSQGLDYLVVTSTLLADALQPLVHYKSETGYRVELRLIENILAQYSGRDDAEKLRECLKQFYSNGGRYVLLGGDETVLPIRYAYPNNAYALPPLDQLQVCDLYFADLTGDWDADGDGVWGEKYSDAVDIEPELLLGRLPLNAPEEAAQYVAKLIRYETDPGGGERDYLQRAFFFSSDQMRDYAENGQHGAIAGAYPDWFEIDTVRGVEQSTGDDPAPTNPIPPELTPAFEQGYGIVNIIAHGRSDGFVLKSSGYNEWPKTYMLSTNDSLQCGLVPNLDSINQAGFYYSLACNNGGFEMDQLPLNEAGPGVAQKLIGSAGGAVGLVAYSRWGWISSSYLLQQSFFDSLFAHPEQPAVEALYASKRVLDYYRDLVYGLNFYGDPTLRIYTHTPARPVITTSWNDQILDVSVTVDGRAATGCRLVLSENGQVLGEFTTSPNGRVTIDYPFENATQYRLSALIPQASVTQIDFIPSLITDVDDDAGTALPSQFNLQQNYPNPFNPSTTITLYVPIRSDVSLHVYDLLGRHVASLLEGPVEPGSHSVTWNGTTVSGEPAGSGVYFYRLESGGKAITKKMILLK